MLSATTVGWPMARRGRFKRIEHVEHGHPILFDLEADPGERTDLAGDPAHAAVLEDLGTAIEDAIKRPPFEVEAATGTAP